MGGEFTYPKMVSLVLTHSHITPQSFLKASQHEFDTLLGPCQGQGLLNYDR